MIDYMKTFIYSKKIIILVPMLLFCFSLFLFTKKPGVENITDRNGNIVGNIKVGAIEHPYDEPIWDGHINPSYIVLYSNSNRWPKHSPFHKKYYGFANLETGFVSDDIYEDLLAFGEDGLAWDYKGHFIDENGNVSITIDNYTKNYTYSDNPRKFFLNLFLNNSDAYEKYYDKMALRDFSSISSENTHDLYIGDYDSCDLLLFPFDEGYAYIDKTGKPAFDMYFRVDAIPTPFNSCGFATVKVTDEDGDKKAVINTKGDYVIAPNKYEYFTFDEDSKTIKAYYKEFGDDYDVFDFIGNELEK